MKQILFAALLLGTLMPSIAQGSGGVFEFTDSNGQCWRCAPGIPCERCTLTIPNARLPNVPDTCPKPDCTADRSTLFPSLTLRQYYQCELVDGVWTAVVVNCPCDTLFSFETQRCEASWTFVPHCRFDLVEDPNFDDCNPTTTTTDTTTVDSTTTTDVASTTSSPCVCVIWWPCWCNPCMMMPRPPSCMMMG